PESLSFDTEIYIGRAAQRADAIDGIRVALKPLLGGNVQIWSYHVGHCWLAIRLTKAGVPGNLHLCCGVCWWVAFDPDYEGAWVEVSEGVDPEGLACYHVRDGERLQVRCQQLAVKRDVEPVYNPPGRTSR